MGFSRQGQQNEYVIKSKINIFKKIICLIFTTIMWVYSALAFVIFFSALFNYNNTFISLLKTSLNINNVYIIEFLLICLLIFAASFLILTFWKTYNKRKYGNLNRRKYPKDTTDEDMLNLLLVDPIDYEILQNNKVITFLNNPIKDINSEDKDYEKAIS